MCGIVGFSGPLNGTALRAALEALAHRGPDDAGVFEDPVNGIGLAHARLSILDTSSLGHQPMFSLDGQIVLIFNGEIYNFRELRKELEEKGHRFRGNSDTEVLLHLYMDAGEAMLSRLNGIFAFALWDERRKAMLVVRDALGVKPLYYNSGQDCFAFASEIKALRCLRPTLAVLDYAALHRYLSFLWCPGRGTPYADVSKLEPGEALWVREGLIERRFKWYRLPAFRMTLPKLAKLEALSGTALHLRRAVYRQMVADVPVGAFLSGGLDSSSVVAFAREQNPDIRCFTIECAGGQEGAPSADDLPYARQVAAHLQVPLEVVRINSTRMAHDLEAMVAQLDEPLADPAPLNVLYISRLAREHGIKVLLSGAGGDDLFTGYRRHRAVQLEHYWNWLPVAGRAGLERVAKGLDQRLPLFRRLAKLFNGAALTGDTRLVNYFVWTRRQDLMALYTPAFCAALADHEATSPMLEFVATMPQTATPLDRMLALEQRFFLTDHNLTYTDKMSMAVGVEVRVPFLDLDLVEFASRISGNLKQRGSVGKWILKKAMEPYLPHNVIYRAKSGFGAPLRRWMRHELRDLLADMLSVESLRKRGLFDAVAVQKLITANDTGKVDAAYTLLSLLCIEIWCRHFIDSDQAAATTKAYAEVI
jgi:asparagine synthase (glutamine-hydrolysing)